MHDLAAKFYKIQILWQSVSDKEKSFIAVTLGGFV
jgi:hypothetical protein